MPRSPHHDRIRREVRALLLRAPAFGRLAPERRRVLANGMVQIGEALSVPGLLEQLEWAQGGVRSQLLALRERLLEGPLARALEQETGKGFTAGAGMAGTKEFNRLVDSVNFPDFVAGLIHGVFEAIVKASIQQMDAYANLVQAIVKSTAQFAQEEYSSDDAKAWLASKFPDTFSIDHGDRLHKKESLSPAAASELGVGQSDEQSVEALTEKARVAMARQRQQTLATIVMMGIERIIVTNGRINAKVLFNVKAEDSATDKSSVDSKTSAGFKAQERVGIWGNGESSSSSLHTFVSTSSDDTSDSKAQLRAKLSGEVDINFKSDTVPLSQMVPKDQEGIIRSKGTPREEPS